MLLAWGLVAHNSGAGWVQAVGDVLAGILAVGLVGPGRRGGAGQGGGRRGPRPTPRPACRVELMARASTRVRVRPLDPPGPRGLRRAAPDPDRDRPGADVGTPPRRTRAGAGRSRSPSFRPAGACTTAIVLEVATRRALRLVVVAQDGRRRAPPRRCTSGRDWVGRCPCPRGREDTSGGGLLDSSVQIGEPRGVRPYRPGDHRRWVHWPATAHSGELMVREMEGPTAEPVTLEVHLPADARGGRGAWPSGPWRRWWPSWTGAPRCSSPPPRRTARGSAPSATGAARAGVWRGPWPSGHIGSRRRVRDIGADERLRRGQARQPAGTSRALDHAARGVRRRGDHRHRGLSGRGRAVVDRGGRVDRARRARAWSWPTAPARQPLPWIKPILAISAVAAFVWFFRQLTGQTIYDVSTVENPLAVLFVWVQVAHAFDVPARRDLAFSLAGLGQPHGRGRGPGHRPRLRCLRRGVAGVRPGRARWPCGARPARAGGMRAPGVLATLGAVVVTGAVVLAVLPAPHVAGRIDFPSAAGPGAPAAGPRRPGRRRQGGAAGQARDSGRRHPGGWLPRVLQPSRHRPARRAGRHRGHAGARRPALVLDRRDLRRLGRRQLEPRRPGRTPAAVGRGLALHPARPDAGSRRGRRPTCRRSTSCSRRPTWCSTPTPRTRCGSPPTTSSSPTTTPSSRPSASGPEPSTRWSPYVNTPTAQPAARRGGPERRHRPSIRGRDTERPPPLPPGPGAGRVGDRGRDQHLRQGRRA